MTLDVLKRLHEKGISDDDLKSAKAYLKGQFPPEIETSDQLAGVLSELVFNGLDEREIDTYYAKIDAATMADVNRVIKQYFPLDNLVFVLVGKASEIEAVWRRSTRRSWTASPSARPDSSRRSTVLIAPTDRLRAVRPTS